MENFGKYWLFYFMVSNQSKVVYYFAYFNLWQHLIHFSESRKHSEEITKPNLTPAHMLSSHLKYLFCEHNSNIHTHLQHISTSFMALYYMLTFWYIMDNDFFLIDYGSSILPLFQIVLMLRFKWYRPPPYYAMDRMSLQTCPTCFRKFTLEAKPRVLEGCHDIACHFCLVRAVKHSEGKTW